MGYKISLFSQSAAVPSCRAQKSLAADDDDMDPTVGNVIGIFYLHYGWCL